jgi:hypothetical protein
MDSEEFINAIRLAVKNSAATGILGCAERPPGRSIALGVANAMVRGDNIFYLYKLPAVAGSNKALRATVEDYHAYAANFLLILAGLHAAAGLVHQYILKVDVLGRMLPALGRR